VLCAAVAQDLVLRTAGFLLVLTNKSIFIINFIELGYCSGDLHDRQIVKSRILEREPDVFALL
jgi:hypothetical protein